MKELILDYSTWRCGYNGENKLGEGATCLLNDEGYMCCLGQFSLQLNSSLKREDIQGFGEPSEVEEKIDALNRKSDYGDDYRNTKVSIEAIDINDDVYTTPEEKIEKLKKLFETVGYEIKVINNDNKAAMG